jgi:hypothetical protein
MADIGELLSYIKGTFSLRMEPLPQTVQAGRFGKGVIECAIQDGGFATDDLRWGEIQRYCEANGWLFTRQGGASASGDQARQLIEKWTQLASAGPVSAFQSDQVETSLVFRVCLAKIEPLALATGYHATRREWVPLICRDGLKPRFDGFRTSSRLDCEGHIYVAEELGTPADVGKPGGTSAHWWRGALASQHKPPLPVEDWAILHVDLGEICEAQVVRDIWSRSGRIILGVDSIPASRIEIVYPVPHSGVSQALPT